MGYGQPARTPPRVSPLSLSYAQRFGASGIIQKRAREMSPMNRKSKGPGASWEEGKVGEELGENPHETSAETLQPTLTATCEDEFLLKACASRQEKLSF
jgi:hypothetical protein